MSKSDTEAWEFFEHLSENSQQWGSSSRLERNPQDSRRVGMFEVNSSPQLMAKLDGLSQKIDAFMASGAHSFQNPSTICAICSSPAHPT